MWEQRLILNFVSHDNFKRTLKLFQRLPLSNFCETNEYSQ